VLVFVSAKRDGPMGCPGIGILSCTPHDSYIYETGKIYLIFTYSSSALLSIINNKLRVTVKQYKIFQEEIKRCAFL
jgi:hypothetical protein